MSKIMCMLPGVGQMKSQTENIDAREIYRIEAIICAVTPAERADVSILNGSRRARIANGSGVEVRDVNNLVNRFVDARKMVIRWPTLRTNISERPCSLTGLPSAPVYSRSAFRPRVMLFPPLSKVSVSVPLRMPSQLA